MRKKFATSAALSVAVLAGTAAAQPELIVAEYQFQAAQMSAVGLNGANPRVLFALPPADWLPLGVTYQPSTQQVIWMDSAGSSELYSAGLNGAGQSLIASTSGFARGASLDASGRIFFSSDNTVRRVNADGSGMVTIFTAATSNPVGMPYVDATNGHVYVGTDGRIVRMDLDGSNVKTVVRGVSQAKAIGLDIANLHIYWADGDTISDFIGRARLDDSDFRVLVDVSPSVVQSPGLTDLLVDPASGALFFTDEFTGLVTRAGLNGESPTPIYTSPAGKAPSGLALTTGAPVQPMLDCNGNMIPDDQDIAAGAPDCDNNGIIDTCQAVNPCLRVFLVDHGSDAANNNGRALGVPSQWQIFQPFDVPTGGWSIREIGLDGYTSNYGSGQGITATIFPDDGTGTRPNESQAIASTTMQLRFSTNSENWSYAPLSATLQAGRYWVRIEANEPTVYGGSLNFGFSGLQSISRGSSGTFTSPAQPIALQLVEGQACYANCDGSTTSPVLNVNDFICFQAAFAAGQPYANCDQSTSEPVLNVNDFICFQAAFAAGCP